MIEPQVQLHPPRVVLVEPQEVADGNWTVRAQTPAGEILYMDRFASQAEADAWIGSDRCDAWLDEQGLTR
jgi:hypothetical protein